MTALDITGCEQRLGARVPRGEPWTLFSEKDLAAVDCVLDSVVPVEHLNRVGRELVGEQPVRGRAVTEPDDGGHGIERLDVQRFLEQRREIRLSADESHVASRALD